MMAKRVVAFVAVLTMAVSVSVSPAHAGLVTTGEALAGQSVEADRARLMGMLERKAVRERLKAWGVDPAEARQRVASLSDAEVARLSGRMEQAPAGGASIVGAAVFVFLVLLITDILGFTDVFPFVTDTVDR